MTTQVRGLVLLLYVRCHRDEFLNGLIPCPFLLTTMGVGECGHMLSWPRQHSERVALIKNGAAAMRARVSGNPYSWDGEEASVPLVAALSEVLNSTDYKHMTKIRTPWDPSTLQTFSDAGLRMAWPCVVGEGWGGHASEGEGLVEDGGEGDSSDEADETLYDEIAHIPPTSLGFILGVGGEESEGSNEDEEGEEEKEHTKSDALCGLSEENVVEHKRQRVEKRRCARTRAEE